MEDLLDRKAFLLEQISYMEDALAQYKKDLIDIEQELSEITVDQIGVS